MAVEEASFLRHGDTFNIVRVQYFYIAVEREIIYNYQRLVVL